MKAKLTCLSRSWLLMSFGLVALALASELHARHWPQFRGPGGMGLSSEKGLPDQWSRTQNLAWKKPLPGEGWAAPVIWDNKVFISLAVPQESRAAADTQAGSFLFVQQRPERPGRGQRPTGPGGRRPGGGGRGPSGPPNMDYRWQLHCLDLSSGNTIWERTAFEGKPGIGKHRDNTYATETPVTDGRHVWVYYGMVGLACYDMQGNLKWKQKVRSLPLMNDWGTASSPVLHDGLLFLQVDNEEQSYVVALDAATGKQRWRKQRDERTSWSSPFIWKNRKRTELVTSASRVRSYDPQSGELLWTLDLGGGRTSASPVGDTNVLVVGSEARSARSRGGGPASDAGGGFLFAVKPGATGDITPNDGQAGSTGVAWKHEGSPPEMASPLIYQGNVFILSRRNGMVSCFDAMTGRVIYQRAPIPEARDFWASPWGYDGKVFCLDANGVTHVLAATGPLKVLRTNSIDERFWASTAMSDTSLLLRGMDNLYCIRN